MNGLEHSSSRFAADDGSAADSAADSAAALAWLGAAAPIGRCATSSPSDSLARSLDVRSVGSIAELSDVWDALAAERPFCTREWLAPWWRHFGRGKRLFLLAVSNAHQETVAIAPLCIERSALGGRVVKFLGSGVVCSDYSTILCRPEHESAAVDALAAYLAGPAAGDWDLIELSGVDAHDPRIRRLVARLAASGRRVDETADQHCWRAELPAAWESYLSGLSASRRQRTRSLLRKTFDSGRARLAWVLTSEQLDRGFEILVDLHTRRRRSLGQQGCFGVAGFREFLHEAAEAMLATGRLRMFWLELDGRPIAVELGMVGDGVVHYYQGGIDPDAAAERPGWLSFAASLRSAIDDGHVAYDFLRGDEAYKASWNAKACPMVEFRIVSRRPAARLRDGFHRFGKLCKQQTRRWLGAGACAMRGALAIVRRDAQPASGPAPEGSE